jgi:hypothetical protein
MSEQTRNQSLTLERLQEDSPLQEHPAYEPQPLHVEDYANHLLDEIFKDVELVLDGSLALPSESLQLDPPAPEIKFNLTAALGERFPQLAEQLQEEAEPAESSCLQLLKEHQPDVPFSLFERLMILTGCTSAVAALGIWLFSQGIAGHVVTGFKQHLWRAPAATLAGGQNQTDAQFADYMLRSLAAMDRESAKTGGPLKAAATQQNSNLSSNAQGRSANPSPDASSNTQLNAAPTTSLVVLPPPTPMAAAPSSQTVASSRPLSSAPADTVTRRELNQVLTKMVTLLERIAGGSIASSSITAGAPKAGASSTPTGPSSGAEAVTAAKAPPAKALPKRTLTGIIELGDRSAVLFEINGVTQRIYLGESVGSTGWNLVEVAKDTAVFRRNGEFQTASVGQALAP